MAEKLAHWDFAESFTADEFALLVLGLDPCKSFVDRHLIYPVLLRLRESYSDTRSWLLGEYSSDYPPITRPAIVIESIGMQNRARFDMAGWLENEGSDFEQQRFSRQSCADWLKSLDLQSAYSFERGEKIHTESPVSGGFDPEDLPPELDCANQAFRAVVVNDWGDTLGTYKQRLSYWIEKHYPNFSSEARERIAIVSNPNKSPGRKKGVQE